METAPASSVLLIDPRATYASLLDGLRPLTTTVDYLARLDPGVKLDGYGMIIADYDSLRDAERDAILWRTSSAKSTKSLVFCTTGAADDAYVALYGSRRMPNILAWTSVPKPESWNISARKLLRRDIFGIEKYFAATRQALSLKITRSSEREAVLRAAEEFATKVGVRPRAATSLCTVADELTANALFDAPVDRSGVRRHAKGPPASAALGPGEEVEIKLCADDRRIGVSVKDPFGSFAATVLLGFLAKSFNKRTISLRQTASDPGLGLHQVMNGVTHLVIGLQPGQRTEVIGLLDLRGDPRESQNKSFSIFTV